MKKIYFLLLSMAIATGAGLAHAETFHVDPLNGSDRNNGRLESPWKTLAKANTTVAAGDIVNLRSGTYTAEMIAPEKSGSFPNYVTYQKYPADKENSVVIANGSALADLSYRRYIKIDGIHFLNAGSTWIRMRETTHCIIQNCTFTTSRSWAGIVMQDGSDYNKFIANVFDDVDPSISIAGAQSMPAEFLKLKGAAYNVFERNTWGKCSHVALYIDLPTCHHNVIRENTFNNRYHTGFDTTVESHWNLVEKNLFYDQGEDYLLDPTPGSKRRHNPAMQINSSYNIIRENIAVNCGSGVNINSLNYTAADNNRIYNNTLYKNYRNEYTSTDFVTQHNIFKNNIFAEGVQYNVYYGYSNVGMNTFQKNNFTGLDDIRYKGSFDTLNSTQARFPDEWFENMSLNPQFVNPIERDFSLKATSPMKNAGTWLAYIKSTTKSAASEIALDDALYFYDGWGIPGESGDIIQTQGGQTTTILNINYSTNVIEVFPAIRIVQNEGVSLKYSGNAPDIGASTFKVRAPSNLKIKVSN